MRTTIEITAAQRAELLGLAARRGEKGFSALIRAAIERYLKGEADRQDRIAAALALRGSLDDEAADRMLKSIKEIRSRWR